VAFLTSRLVPARLPLRGRLLQTIRALRQKTQSADVPVGVRQGHRVPRLQEYAGRHFELQRVGTGNGERGTSSHCLKCSHQHKPTGRNWVLNACGFTGHRDLVGSVNMHEIAFQKKTTFPVSKDVTYRRSGTPCWKYLNRSSRRDTGHRKGFGPLSPALSEVCLESTTDSIRVPEGAGYIYVRTSEAISL
jgi:Putative transposase DNA-binding domain